MEKLFTGGKLMNSRASASGLFTSGARMWKKGCTIFWKCQRTPGTGGRNSTASPPGEPGEFCAKTSCDQSYTANYSGDVWRARLHLTTDSVYERDSSRTLAANCRFFGQKGNKAAIRVTGGNQVYRLAQDPTSNLDYLCYNRDFSPQML